MSSQVLIMALIVQHGFYMLGRVSGPVCDWVRFTSPVLCQPWDMGLVRDCFQIFVQHTLEGLSCASRGISDVLRKTIEQPGTLDREGGLSKCLYGWRGCGCDTRYMAFSTSPGVPLILYRVQREVWHLPFNDAPCVDDLVSFTTTFKGVEAQCRELFPVV